MIPTSTLSLSNSNDEPRYRTLDPRRGLDCLMVIVFHATLDASASSGMAGVLIGMARYGWVGVPIFFAISGYCIAVSLAAERRRGGTSSGFLIRRMCRIYPPYWVLLIFTVALVGLVEGYWRPGFFAAGQHPITSPRELTASQWLGALTLTETWRHHFGGGPMRHFVGHSWSLCYEVQFYAIAAMVFWADRRRPMLGFVLITLFTLVGRHLMWHFVAPESING